MEDDEMVERKTRDEVRETLTVEETGRILGIGRSAAYAAVARGEIPSLRIGSRLLVPRVALGRLLRGERVRA